MSYTPIASQVTQPLDSVDSSTAAAEFRKLKEYINGITTVASSTTPDIFNSTNYSIDYTGTAVATGFVAAPIAGAERRIYCAAAAQFTAGANLLIDNITAGDTLVVAAGTTFIIHAVTTTQFRIVFDAAQAGTATPIKSDGAGVVGTSVRYSREDHKHPLSSGDLIKFTIITASNAAWAKQALTTKIVVRVLGGGGGGRNYGSITFTKSIGGGKKGEEYWGVDMAASATYNVVVGAGGIGRRYDGLVEATAGGTSSFGTVAAAAGGLPGNGSSTVNICYNFDGEPGVGPGGVGSETASGGSAGANSAAGGGATIHLGSPGGNGGSGVIYVWEYA